MLSYHTPQVYMPDSDTALPQIPSRYRPRAGPVIPSVAPNLSIQVSGCPSPSQAFTISDLVLPGQAPEPTQGTSWPGPAVYICIGCRHKGAYFVATLAPAIIAIAKQESVPSPTHLSMLPAHQTLKESGLGGLFRGMGAPLATVALFNAVLFATRGQMEQLLAHDDGAATHRCMHIHLFRAGIYISHLAQVRLRQQSREWSGGHKWTSCI